MLFLLSHEKILYFFDLYLTLSSCSLKKDNFSEFLGGQIVNPRPVA